MSYMEKRHINHQMGSMLHHRFPNGFTDLIMDETDREVSTLTDRAFRSLCVGDEAVYNDVFFCGFSPYSCLKPLAGEPFKADLHKESKNSEQHQPNKSNTQHWKQHQQENITHMSSFLKVLHTEEERTGGMRDSNAKTWDKSTLRSIEKELSEFSSDYDTSLSNTYYKNQSFDGFSNKKSVRLSSKKLTKIKNGKSTVKLRKLNIKNFFLHSEFSPFQSWTDLNQYPFSKDNTVTNIVSADNVPKWYNLPFYKERTEVDTTQVLNTGQVQLCQKDIFVSSSAKVPEPTTTPPQSKVLPKPVASLAEQMCLLDRGDTNAAPWRHTRPGAKNVILAKPAQESNSKQMDENDLVIKKGVESFEIKEIQDVGSLASTPFSIPHLMTPVIPSREAAETLQTVFPPSVYDLLSRTHSEAKVTPEPPVKRETYKSLASSILFNLKDNRKRMKSQYSPQKFKTFELFEGGYQTLPSDNTNPPLSEGSDSGLSTPSILKGGLTVSSTVLEHIVSPSHVDITTHNSDKPVSEDYLLEKILQVKCEASNINYGEDSSILPLIVSKNSQSPIAKKQNYPSLTLYKKTNHVNCYQGSQGNNTFVNTDILIDGKKEISPNSPSAYTGLSSIPLKVNKDYLPIISPQTLKIEQLSSGGELNVQRKPPWLLKYTKECAVQLAPKEDNTNDQTVSITNVIRTADKAINMARSPDRLDSNSKHIPDISRQQGIDQRELKQVFESGGESLVTGNNNDLLQNEPCSVTSVGKNSNVGLHKEPPPVPKRHFSKSDVLSVRKQHLLSVGKQQRHADKASNADLVVAKLDLLNKESEPAQEQAKNKQLFSSRQNSCIKHQNYSVTSDEQAKYKERNLHVKTKMETDVKLESIAHIRDTEHIFNDFKTLQKLERAQLNDCNLEKVRSRLEIFRIDKEAKNNLISRQLRNMKRGMISVRGNDSTKKKVFVEREQCKQDVLVKQNSNVTVIKALLNDNCDKAKIALEEVISEQEKSRSKFREEGEIRTAEDNFLEKSWETWSQEGTKVNKNCMLKPAEENNNTTFPHKEKNLKQRFGDLKTLPAPIGMVRLGNNDASPGMYTEDNKRNVILNIKAEGVRKQLDDCHTHIRETRLPETVGHMYNHREKYLINEREDELINAAPVAPRTEKEVRGGNGSVSNTKDTVGNMLYGKNQKFGNNQKQLCRISTGPEIYVSGNIEEYVLCQHETYKAEGKSPLKTDSVNKQNDSMIKNCTPKDEHFKINNKDINIEAEKLGEIPRNTVSHLLLKKDVTVRQSPPDHASMSPKSFYVTVESTLHRTTENSLDFYFLENSPTKVGQVNELGQTLSPNDLREAGVEYSYLSGNEYKLDCIKQPLNSNKSQQELQDTDSPAKKFTTYEKASNKGNNSTKFFPSTFSPTLRIQDLFKDKEKNRSKEHFPPFSPRKTISGLGFDKQLNQTNKNQEPSMSNEPSISNSGITLNEVFKGKKISEGSCTFIPQEEERLSTPSSEGKEGLQATMAELTDDLAKSSKVVECEKTKDIYEPEWISRNNDGQIGLPRPPIVLPKSEKAIQKAIKLTNRRMKKDESQTLTPKSSQSSRKQRAENMTSNKSEQKKSGRAKTRSSNKKNCDDNCHISKHHSNHSHVQDECDPDHHNQNKVKTNQKSWRQTQVSKEGNDQRADEPPNLPSERQTHTTDRDAQEKTDCKNYSSESIISNVPVYKAHIGERPISKRPVSERLEPRTQSIEQSIKDELQQRGGAKDKPNRGLPVRRSQSTDPYNTDRIPLYIESNYTSQSSLDNVVLTQSIPMTQRKLLQDPDSGQYFFVDLPVQVKTKTFFDPATRGYVQLQVQPSDGGITQSPQIEILTSPLVVYHSFVPVPLSPMAQKANIQASHVEPRGLEYRHQETERHIKGRCPYLDPAYCQHELILGDFLDTEEVDYTG